jgi:hypothetical protein
LAADGMGARSDTRLSQFLLGAGTFNWSTFTPLRSNFSAFESAVAFARGNLRYVILAGPTGWGKSHLIHAAAEMAIAQGGAGLVVSVHEALQTPELAFDPRPVLIDNVHDVRRRPRWRHELLKLVALRLRHRRPTLVCLDEAMCGRLIKELAALSHEDSVTYISNPTEEERELLILQAAGKMGLELHRSIARMMARHHEGNAHTIMGALNRLSLGKGPWNTESALGRASGLIFPDAVGADGWDLRDLALAAAQGSGCEDTTQRQEQAKVFCWLMRRVVAVPEASLASYLRCTTSQVFRWTQECEAGLSCPQFSEKCRIARVRLLESLRS